MKNSRSLRKWLDDMNLSHPLLIAGPCSAETEVQVLDIANQLKDSDATIYRAGIWKPRTRPGNFEGVGALALEWLKKVKKETGILTTTEVANANHVDLALKNEIDILWIGARTTVSPFIVQEIAEALRGTNKIVLIKNPVNPDLSLWMGAIERFYSSNIKKVNKIIKDRDLSILMFSNDLHMVMSSTRQVICLYHHVCCSGEPQIVAKDPEFISLFGNDMAKMMSVYQHTHNHSHQEIIND